MTWTMPARIVNAGLSFYSGHRPRGGRSQPSRLPFFTPQLPPVADASFCPRVHVTRIGQRVSEFVGTLGPVFWTLGETPQDNGVQGRWYGSFRTTRRRRRLVASVLRHRLHDR